MTDYSDPDFRAARLKKTLSIRKRFRAYDGGHHHGRVDFGVFAVSIVYSSLPAFSHHHVRLDINVSQDYVVDAPEEGNYLGLVRAALRDHFPQVTGRRDKRALYKILSIGAHRKRRRASSMIRALSARE